MRTTSADNPVRTSGGGGPRAFTLIELLLVVAIIGVLMSLLAVGFAAARRAARAAGDRQAVVSLSMGAEQFKTDHAFAVPLVFDGAPLGGGMEIPQATDAAGGNGPVFSVTDGGVERWLVSVWNPGATQDLEFLRQRNASGAPDASGSGQGAWSDPRYSKYALAYYLAGALPEFVDGVEGLGMLEPLASGGFRGVGAVVGRGRDRYEAYADTGSPSISIQDGYYEASEFEEHGSAVVDPSTWSGQTQNRFRFAITDREGVAYRYYRWETGNTGNTTGGRGSLVETTGDLNIPAALLDPVLRQEFLLDPMTETDLTDGDPALRGARSAIVGAGPNGVFGTEPIAVLADALGRGIPSTPEGQAGLRRLAWEDNVVEVGE